MNYYENIKEQFIKNELYKRVKDYSKNRNDLETYYNVGKLLVEAQGGENHAKYGNQLIKEYSLKLTKDLGKGYNISSLKRMRQFYLIFGKGATVSHQLSWSHYCEILPIKEQSKRNYYMNICINENLSIRELRTRIKNNEYERLGFIDKEKIKLDDKTNNVSELIKNPILIKNNRNEKVTEYVLKQLILEDIDSFLKELGQEFCYVGNEYKIKIGNNYHYIDLLLYNIKFNCYVVIELKITEFKSEYIGQVKKYMNYVDKNIKAMAQEKTIGIIICKKENRFVLEYISDEKIFTTTYKLV